MKYISKSLLILIVGILSMVQVNASSLQEFQLIETFLLKYESPFGIWNCQVLGAAPEYQKSTLIIQKDDKGLPKVTVELSTGSLTGNEVELTDKVIKFNLNIEGVERVTVILEFSNDILEGRAITSEGDLKVTCTRKTPSIKS